MNVSVGGGDNEKFLFNWAYVGGGPVGDTTVVTFGYLFFIITIL